jgi:hypothetical protein
MKSDWRERIILFIIAMGIVLDYDATTFQEGIATLGAGGMESRMRICNETPLIASGEVLSIWIIMVIISSQNGA